ncbi:MAG: NADH-quinone oxidoreductase subunit M [Actinobacteria bacterium]|nr:NADH-quinone oxidoreductase subunit M [Actinomycetota bacterium]MBI3686847.1 NADH-quinone oxidoreductase subunit M [Actinomycetota bacterium]
MSDSLPFLLVLLLVPLVGSVVVWLLPRTAEQLAKLVALATSLLTVVVMAATATAFDPNGARFQLTWSRPWIASFGVDFALGVDGIALVLIALVAVLVPSVILASWHEETPAGRSPKTFFALLLLLEVFMVGVFAVTDVFVFYVFFEAMLVPMYFLIGAFGGPRRQYAAMKFFLYSLLGGLLMLAAVIGLYVVSASQLGHGTFAFSQLVGMPIDADTEKLLFLGFFVAFAIKAPLVPFHTWLPDAGAEAPAGGAALLVGVLDKVGTFGFLRYCLPLFPNASRYFAPAVIVLAVVGVLYAALLAMGQRDMKRLVAYTSVAHFGFIGLGIFAFTTQSMSGSVFYMINHGLATGALFLVAGMLISRGRSREISDYGGVAKTQPLLGGAFLLAGLASLALPGMSTFISEFLVLVGTFSRHRVYGVVATVGIILAALYILLMYQRMFHGPAQERAAGWLDMSAREAWAVAPLLALIVVLGVYPKPVLDVIRPAVNATMNDVHQRDPAPTVAVQTGATK